METFWYVIVALMITMYVILDGFDLGAGIIQHFAGKTQEERKQILRAIGPVWDGNEVWLLAAGGTLFFSFPVLYAASFSGFYLPLMMVLWLLMLRGIGIELREHIDWYTALMGVVAFTTVAVHGANYISLKTEGNVQERARHISRHLGRIFAVLAAISLIATLQVRPQMLDNYKEHFWGWVIPLIVIGGLTGMHYFRMKGRDYPAFLSSAATIVGMLGGAAFGLYPNVLPSTLSPEYNLTIWNTAAHSYGLRVGVIWWSIGITLAAIYFIYLYRSFRGKVTLEEEGY